MELARPSSPKSLGASSTGRVMAMSDSEALVRWLVESHIRQTDEITTTMALEPPVAIPLLRSMQERFTRLREEIGFGGQLFVEAPLGLFLSVNNMHRRIDALARWKLFATMPRRMTVSFPNRSTKSSETPVPLDLLTGKPFHYDRSADGVALLSATGIETPTGKYPGLSYRIVLHDKKPAAGK